MVVSLLSARSSPATEAGASPGAAIEFTVVPSAGGDNPRKVSAIKGRVFGAQPGQRIVLYAKASTAWWVQPYADHPFTTIERDSSWTNSTHPGTDYAALLVGPDFNPPPTTGFLPTQGVLAFAVVKGEVPVWQKWWFALLCMIGGAPIIYLAHLLRLRQMSKYLSLVLEERLAERTRVAQELHDTLLQGVLSASMQLHVAADQVPEESPAKPGLNRVLELMSQVVAEGRNTLRGLRSTIDPPRDLETSFSRVPKEVGARSGVQFRVVVEGSPSALRSVVRDDVYAIGREALVNAFRHSSPTSVNVNLEYAPTHLRVLVRDDGCGIDPNVLESGRDGHWGLSGMRERAQRIGARLKVLSRPGHGTEVDLRVPSGIAFESAASAPASNWFKRLQLRKAEASGRESKQGVRG